MASWPLPPPLGIQFVNCPKICSSRIIQPNPDAAVEPVITKDAIRAADLIAASKAASSPAGSLSLGDGLCIAVAERLELPITGGDLYWETLELRVKVLSFR